MTVTFSAIIGAGTKVIEFSVDWNSTFTIQEGDSLWSDGVTASIASPSGDTTLSRRTSKAMSSITVPGGSTLDNHIIHYIQAEIYRTTGSNAVANAWGETGIQNAASGAAGFVRATVYDGNIIFQTGVNGLAHKQAKTSGSPFGDNVGAFLGVAGIPPKIKIVCSLEG